MHRKFFLLGGLYAVALFLSSPYLLFFLDAPQPADILLESAIDVNLEGRMAYEVEEQLMEVDYTGKLKTEPFRVEAYTEMRGAAFDIPVPIGSIVAEGDRVEVALFDNSMVFEMDIEEMVRHISDELILADKSIDTVDFGDGKQLVMVYTYEMPNGFSEDSKLILNYSGIGKLAGFLVELPLSGQLLVISGQVLSE